MALFSKTKPLVGLDIGSSSLKAVELIKIKKNFQLSGFAYEPISPDAVVDGAIMDFLPIAETIKTSFVGAKFKAKGVATGVSGHSVIVKRVVIPATTAEEVEASIQIDADQYIPFDVSVGGNQYTDILQKELQLSFQEAEDLKLGRTGGTETEMVQPLLESITEMLIMEVQKTFDFFRETYPSETISRVLLSGGTCRMPGLAEKLQATFGYPTEILDPFKAIAIGPKVNLGKLASLGPALAVAVGLALRGFDQ